MKENKINEYLINVLNKKTAEKYKEKILQLVSQIPLVSYIEKEILADNKGERKLFGKWEHSLVVFDGNIPIAVIIGYERLNEKNKQYPENTLYVSELAVDKAYQKKGIARQLIKYFFDYNTKLGFQYLKGEINFSIQTNAASWNKHVQNLYYSFGFTQRATKEYSNRTDIILGWKP